MSGAAAENPHHHSHEDCFEVGMMNLNGCLGFALDVGETQTKLAYIKPAPEDAMERVGYNPYHVNYDIKLLTFTDLDNALAYLKEHVATKDFDLKYPKSLKLGTGSGLARHTEKIDQTLGFSLDEENQNAHGKGLFYGVKRYGRKFFRDAVYVPEKTTVAADVEKYQSEVRNYQTKMEATPKEKAPEPDDVEAIWKIEEKQMNDHLPSLIVSMDEPKMSLVSGERDFEDIPANDKVTVSSALQVAREKKAKGIFFYGDHCHDHSEAVAAALKELPTLDMKNSGGALVAGIVHHERYLEVLGTLMDKVHFMRLLMICPCGPCEPLPEMELEIPPEEPQ